MRKSPRCPRCGKPPERYTEMWTGHTIVFDADANGVPDEFGELGEGGPYCVFARCGKCGREWRLRGVVQITDLHEARK